MNCIVNLVTDKGNYRKAQDRLRYSLSGRNDADTFFFFREESVGAPLHSENNYAFKIYAIQKVIDLGYTRILWLDSSCYAVSNVKPIFDKIESQGYFIAWSGWQVGEWTNQRTLDYFGVEDAMKMKMFSSGVTGINLEHPIGLSFFEIWKQSMLDGQFNGSWDDHRHDQSCGSIIANQLGMKQEKGNHYYQYKCDNAPIKKSTIFLLEGL